MTRGESSKNRHGQHCVLESLNMHRTLAGEYWPHVDLEDVYVDFESMGTCAGMAYWKSGRLRINVDLLEGDTLDEMWRQTLPHELAHIIANRMEGKKTGHQRSWKRVMEMFGLKAERTHNMEVEHLRRKSRTATCQCDCKTWELTARRVNAINRGTKRYACPSCHSTIIVMGKLS